MSGGSTGISAGGSGCGFQLGQAANYGLVAFQVGNFSCSSSSLLANVAIGECQGQVSCDQGSIGGRVDCNGSYGNSWSGGGQSYGGGQSWGGGQSSYGGQSWGGGQSGGEGSWNGNQNQVGTCSTSGTVVGDLCNLSKTAAGYGGTTVSWSGRSSSLTLNATNGALCNGNYVFNLTGTGICQSSGKSITINGTANQYVIININCGNGNVYLPTVNLCGGITSDHVLFNYTGTGEVCTSSSTSANNPFCGTFLGPNCKVNLSGGCIDGRVYGGGSGQDFNCGSGCNLKCPPCCFYPGTLIATPTGQVAVEDLKAGDLVLTHDGQVTEVVWMGRQSVCTVFADPLRALPIRICAGALGPQTPSRDLLVSSAHALLVDGVLVQAAALINGLTIYREVEVPQIFTYWHIETQNHALVIAEGAAAETFADTVSREAFDNWDEHEALFPEGRDMTELPLPRAQSVRQVPRAIRQRLDAIAQALVAVPLAA